MPHHDSRPTTNSWLTTLGWAAYLACSWTWCIGMFLPVLLIRDFGIWGFIVFAVPNVVGAAAMGWVLRRPGASESLVLNHRLACLLFSLVTALFQLFFLAWMIGGRFPDSSPPPSRLNLVLLAAIPAAILLSLPSARPKPKLYPAVILLVVSMVAVAVAFVYQYFIYPDPAVTDGIRTLSQLEPPRELAWLAPVCAFGFLLCPYLDLTFHHARQQTDPDSGVAAFLMGFTGFFLCLILFTLWYAGWFLFWPHRNFVSIGLCAVIVHILAQATFTAVLHGAELLRSAGKAGRQAKAMSLFGLLVTGVLAWIAIRSAPWNEPDSGQPLKAGEIVYRLFMSFYGLVFPAYVWLCMIPTRNEPTTQPPSRTKLIILFTAIVLAAPFYWMGFIERQTWYLAPGLAIVLFARLFLPRSGRTMISPY